GFRLRGSVGGFDPAGQNPTHVEAGAGGDFYGLDMSRWEIVRLGRAARRVKTYPLPDGRPNEKQKRTYRDFRVCEKTRAFYLFYHSGLGPRIACVGFDGKERWTYAGRMHILYTSDGNRVVGAFDVDEGGVLYVLDGESVKKLDPGGKPAGAMK